MNIGAVLVLLKLWKDAGVAVSPIGPPAPPPAPGKYEARDVKPMCSPGYFAYQHPRTGFWTCKPIPKGR